MGWWVAMKWLAALSKKLKRPNGVNLELHISQDVAKSMPSLISQLCGDSLLAVCCPGKMGQFIDHPSTHRHQTS